MEGYQSAEPPKSLPPAIHELQRILHDAGDARRAAVQRMRELFAHEPPEDLRIPVRVRETASRAEECLIAAIREALERVGVSFVFGEQLSQVWPASTTSELEWRTVAVREFANRNGWAVFVMNDGNLAMFRRLERRGAN
jgi:hypothetical protein